MTKEYKLIPTNCRTPVVELRILGQPHRFILDTGATITILCHKLLDNFKYTMTHSGIMYGIGKDCPQVLRVSVQFNIFGTSLSSVVMSDRMENIKQSLPFSISGLIGQDILSQFEEVTFNYRKNVVKFSL